MKSHANILLLFFGLFFVSCETTKEETNGLTAPETAGASQTEQGNSSSGTTDPDETSAAVEATITNLMAAYAGETTASAKYAAYAQKATAEGHPRLALLFKATSRSERIHADNHRAVLEEMGKDIPEITPQFTVGTSKENLTDAIAGESYEIATMYPEFLTAANTADNQLALVSFNYAYKTEMKHKPLYENALALLLTNQLETLPNQYLICPTCGNTYDGIAPKRCRISMTDGNRFIKITA